MSNENENLNNEGYPSEAPSHQDKKQPWTRKFGEDENIKNRQYSRAARNQPAKEATTLSKVLLGIIVLTVLTPFIIFMVVDAQRSNDQIETRTAENITISRSIENEASSSETSVVSSEESSSEASEASRESIESIESIQEPVSSIEQPAPPVEEPVQPTPPAEPAGTVYTVQAGDSWYAIARNYGVDVYALAAHNNATIDTPIYPGLTIVIP